MRSWNRSAERRQATPWGDAAGDLGQRVVLGDVGAGEHVEPSADALDLAAPMEPGERLARDAERGEVLRAEDAALAGEGEEAVSVCHVLSAYRA